MINVIPLINVVHPCMNELLGRRKGGLSTTDQSGEERAREEGIPLNPLEAQEKQGWNLYLC